MRYGKKKGFRKGRKSYGKSSARRRGKRGGSRVSGYRVSRGGIRL